MSGCDLDTIEALALGELSAEDAAIAASHLAGCPSCTEELTTLRGLRLAVAGAHRRVPERTSHLFPLIAERTRARRTVRRQLAGMALTFASLAAVIAVSLPSAPAAAHHTASSCGRQCVEPDVCEASALDDVALLEERFAACLIATPVALP